MSIFNTDTPLPDTVDEAVNDIISDMPLDERVRLARMTETELDPIKLAMRAYVQDQLEESGINEKLKASCCELVGRDLDEVGTSTVIIDDLWRRLRETHGLRVVV